MRHRADLPLELRERPFTVVEAHRLGVSRSRLAGDDLRAPHRGVRVPAVLPDTVEVRASAALLALPRGVAFTGATALSLCRLPLPLRAPDPRDGPLEVAVPAAGPRPRVEGVTARRATLDGEVLVLRRSGLPVVHPRHLWCDLAAGSPLEDAVGLADAVLRRWATRETMARVLAGRPGRRGVAAARRVLSLARGRVDSPMETRARLVLVARGVPEPCCGRDVVEHGDWLARPDLSWPAVRVAAEHDGDHHRTDRRQWHRDIVRRRLMEARGWRVLAFTADDVLRAPEQMAALVAGALRDRGVQW